MANNAMQRLMRDVRDVQSDEQMLSEFNIELPDSIDSLSFEAKIGGPPETPYAGGTFTIRITIPSDYPSRGPAVRFVSRVWHPNVHPTTNSVCVDVFQDKWRSSLRLRTVFLTVHGLLESPEPASPLNEEAANQMETPDLFNKTATMWTYIFALGPKCIRECFQKLCHLAEMKLGHDELSRLRVLSCNNWNLEESVAVLINDMNVSEDEFQ